MTLSWCAENEGLCNNTPYCSLRPTNLVDHQFVDRDALDQASVWQCTSNDHEFLA